MHMGTLGARRFFFRREAAIVSCEAVIEILTVDRGFAARNRCFATKKEEKNPLAPG